MRTVKHEGELYVALSDLLTEDYDEDDLKRLKKSKAKVPSVGNTLTTKRKAMKDIKEWTPIWGKEEAITRAAVKWKIKKETIRNWWVR